MRVAGNAGGSVGGGGPHEGSFVSSPARTADKRGGAGPFTGGFEAAAKQQKFLSVYQVSSLGGSNSQSKAGKETSIQETS